MAGSKAKRWVKWEWSHSKGKPVKAVLKPTELKVKGAVSPVTGYVREGSQAEWIQREPCGQLDLFDIRDAA